MTAALPPSRGIGIAGTTLAHGGLIALALIASRPSHSKPLVTYAVTLLAAPKPVAGPSNVIAPAKQEVAPVVKPKPSKVPAKKVLLQSKQTAPVIKTPVAPAPVAKASTGTDVVSLHQDGLVFPYEYYLKGIENAIQARWQHESFRPGLDVKVAFVIARDGTVDPKSVQITRKSGNSFFDDNAVATIELASSARAFGALPSGWNGASLPIEFDFLQAKGTP